MKPKEMGIFEVKNKLSDLVDQVERGQRIYITRRGKRVALLTSAEESHQQEATSILKAIRLFRSNAKQGPESLKELIEEGRK